ncbi:MAG: hypothetical protein CBB71_01590 [Rhodopirellula sp. TMED11]|nr:MAG: hypothetical protein CBB71_01590 [Rhodopirellula sp. TMED11]
MNPSQPNQSRADGHEPKDTHCVSPEHRSNVTETSLGTSNFGCAGDIATTSMLAVTNFQATESPEHKAVA